MFTTQWHLSLSTQRQSSVYPSTQRQVWVGSVHKVLILHHSSSSFTMVPWPLITLLAGLERTATIWGFWKAPLPGKAVTVSPWSTLVVSKFNCFIEVVTTSAYPFSSSILSGGAIGQVSSTPDMVGEAVWAVASIDLVFCSTGQSSTWSLAKGNCGSMWWQWWFHSFEACWGSLGPLAGSPLGWPSLSPWMMSHLVKSTCSFTLSLSSMIILAKGQKSRSSGGLSFSVQYCYPWA